MCCRLYRFPRFTTDRRTVKLSSCQWMAVAGPVEQQECPRSPRRTSTTRLTRRGFHSYILRSVLLFLTSPPQSDCWCLQESSEEPDYDQVAGGKVAAPVPPSHQAGEETVRRRAKRERNNRAGPGCCDSTVNSHQHRRSKSRSKSRSPGREIDRAIVIVHHHTTCSHSRLDRTASPDNLSESSISFHENEVNFDLSPGSVSRPLPPENILPEPPVLWYERSPGNVKKCDSNSQKYSNWESCRESWFSSGSSEVRPSSGSDCPPCPPVRPTESSAPNTPHCRRSQESSSPSTLPRSAVRPQSSRDSDSSSSRPNSRPNTRPNTRYPLPPLHTSNFTKLNKLR